MTAATLMLSGCGDLSDEGDSASSGLSGTCCAKVSNNQNCRYFDSNTGSSRSTFWAACRVIVSRRGGCLPGRSRALLG